MTWGPWDEVEAAIQEIEWFATRKKDLAERIDAGEGRVWADVLLSDVDYLRRVIGEAREGKLDNNPQNERNIPAFGQAAK